MENDLFLIERIRTDDEYRFYADQGSIGGVKDAIAYETAAHAQKFRRADDARHFIDTKLPNWSKPLHRVTVLRSNGLVWDKPVLAAALELCLPISEELLQPTAGRLHIWRR